jgi:hypothetical protein
MSSLVLFSIGYQRFPDISTYDFSCSLMSYATSPWGILRSHTLPMPLAVTPLLYFLIQEENKNIGISVSERGVIIGANSTQF